MAYDWILHFPKGLKLNVAAYIDKAVTWLNIHWNGFFSGIKTMLNSLIATTHSFLNFIPWWVLIILVMFLGWKASKKWLTSVLYGFFLFLIGLFGFWNLMNETLSIVIVSVFFSLLFGLPLGIFISMSERANTIVRPILDAMQTMPTFVYMIPVVIFLGPGKVPAVLATMTYAIVPVVRLTSHGIRQVDGEVIEAARAFGSTRWQTLIKVQIPQAIPTIMTGVNQTLMMAVAMVVTCAMIGANGLGMEVLIAINRTESGRGFVAGFSIVILAIIIDRLTQGSIKNPNKGARK